MSRKQDVLCLEEEGEEGMIHSLLSSLPNLSDGMESEACDMNTLSLDSALARKFLTESDLHSTNDNKTIETRCTEPLLTTAALDSITTIVNGFSPQEMQEEGPLQDPRGPAESEAVYVRVYDDLSLKEELPANSNIASMADTIIKPQDNHEIASEFSVHDSSGLPAVSSNEQDTQTTLPANTANGSRDTRPINQMLPSSDDDLLPDNCQKFATADKTISIHSNAAEIQPGKSEHLQREVFVTQEDEPRSKEPEETANSTKGYSRRTLLITDLLKLADALYAEFPPSHAGLHLSSIMGPQSVIFTWSEQLSDLPSDEEAEAMVQRPELIVYPHVDIQEDTLVEEKEPSRLSSFLRRRKGKENLRFDKATKSKRQKVIKIFPYSHPEKRKVIAGAVLIIGAAMAIYGIQNRNLHLHGQPRVWDRVCDMLARVVATTREKI